MSLNKLKQSQRGYLANIQIVPPLIYPFQYNPTKLKDSKQVEWQKMEEIGEIPKGLEGIVGGITGAVSAFKGGVFKGISRVAETDTKILGRTFSKATFKNLKSEKDRNLSFKFVIDGREKRPGEPTSRREDGHILADLAILRSFVYTKTGEMLEILRTLVKLDYNSLVSSWFDEPPTILLILGSMAVEGYVTNLTINETMFDEDLNPTRAEIEIAMIEKIDSLTFVIDSLKRIYYASRHSAYKDIGKVIF